VSPVGIGGGQALGLLVVRGRIADERHGGPIMRSWAYNTSLRRVAERLAHGALHKKPGDAPANVNEVAERSMHETPSDLRVHEFGEVEDRVRQSVSLLLTGW